MIRVIDDYVIRAAEYDYHAEIEKTTKNGETKYVHVAYCSSVRKCVEAIYRHMARETMREFDGTLSEAIEVLENIEKRFEDILTSIPNTDNMV